MREKPKRLIFARVLEALGIRALHLLLAKIGREHAVPSAGQVERGVGWRPTAEEMPERIKWTRYFGASNIIKIALYIPMMGTMVYHSAWGLTAWALSLIGLHLLMLVVELYKSLLYQSMVIQGRYGDEPEPTIPEPVLVARLKHWYFTPRRFENQRFYEVIGVDQIRRFVVWYTNKVRGTNGKRRSSFMGQPSRHGLLLFEAKTRVSEMVHLSGVALNFPFLAFFWVHGSWWLTVYATLFWMVDLSMVLLQRFLRVRVWKSISRPKLVAR